MATGLELGCKRSLAAAPPQLGVPFRVTSPSASWPRPPPSPQLQQQLRGGTARCQGRCFPRPRTQTQVRGRQDQMGWAWYPSVPSQDLGANVPLNPGRASDSLQRPMCFSFGLCAV